ncbi:MAG: hypothetical protein JNM69_33710 [Archangium sp.]|nr:hypothetical protein [Archangium sp.]
MAASLYGDPSAKLEQAPWLTKRGGPRVDSSLLRFDSREDVRALSVQANAERSAAVERLRLSVGRR